MSVEYHDIPDLAKQFRHEVIGGCVLFNADCLAVLPTLGKVDAVVTDPPYGIKQGNGFDGFGRFGGFGPPIKRRQYENGEWDNERPTAEVFTAILEAAPVHIIWGGNYFTDLLPISRKWLFWDKCQTMPTYSDGEMAWTSLPGVATKRLTYNNNGLMVKEKDRVHPTQKPVEVMKWCVQMTDGDVLDPFAGSGTTGVACVKLGRKFIGIEIEERYFKIACDRIQKAVDEPRLPLAEPKPKQVTMELT